MLTESLNLRSYKFHRPYHLCLCSHYKEINNYVIKARGCYSTKRYKMFHSRISPDAMVIFICFTHTLSHSGGGSRNHVFLPLTIACHEGRCTASIYYSQKCRV